MNINSNSSSQCVRSKYFTGQTDMDESLSDFQEEKKSCKGPKPNKKPAKPKSRKVTKRIKGQNDIRTALKGKKNELVAYSKEFDTVCKKSGLDVDSEQLQLAIALSKSLQTESNAPETSQALSSQQRVAKIRKTLQEYGFKVPEAKISVGKKTKKYRKQYKLLTVPEEEKHQNITGKYTRILFENLDQSKVEQESYNIEESARIFYIASSIPYEYIKDNNIFYVDDLVEKSTTSGLLLRDWSEIPGRPESPKLVDTFAMNFKDIDCSQDELDIILSGPVKSVKDIFASKEMEYKRKYKDFDVPKLVIEDEEMIPTEDIESKIDKDVININRNVHESGLTENSDSLQKPAEVEINRSPVKILLEDKTLVTEVIELISPIKQVNGPKEVINIETSDKQYRSCSPDIFDDEISSIMETSKPVVVLSQEHKTKVFSQDNYMDLTQCANIPSQHSEKGIQLSQNITKRRSNDFMEITDCIVGSSQPIREELKEIDLTQSPEDNGAIVDGNININEGDNVSKNATDSTSINITDEQQITVLSNHLNTDSRRAEKEDIDLTQSSNEDESRTNIELNVERPGKKVEESMDLTQSSNSTDVSLPLVDVGNSQSQASLDDTIIVDKDEYIAKIKKSCFSTEASSQVVDLTQAQDISIEYHPSPVKVASSELCSNSFYEDFVHEHSTNTENSKETALNSDLNEQESSYNESKEANDDIDLTQGSSSSEEIVVSQRPSIVHEKAPNNSSLGKQDDVSIDYDEIIIEDNINNKESFRDNGRNSNLTQQHDLSEIHNDLETVNDNNDLDINSSQNSELGFQISDNELDYSLHESRRDFQTDKGRGKDNVTQHYDSSKLEADNDIEILDDNDDDINSSQNSEVFRISDKELDYSLHKSRRDYSINNFNVKENEEDKNMNLKYDSSKSEVDNDIEILDDNNEADLQSSQNSEAFQISDKELDYSLHKSRRDFPVDNFEFGSISVLDNVTTLGRSRKSLSEGCEPYFNEDKNDMEEDSYLPEVYVKKTDNKIVETTQLEAEGMSPIKVQEILRSKDGIINIKTPKNSEYIIKTVDVTPMADFASMSTPQRNRELDRYGLKPFKRKRAIQILTHLYNQTHPTIQQLTDEDQPSPSKKPRTNTYTQESPPKRSITSPEKSPAKEAGWSKTPEKSPLKFTWKKPTKETRLHASPKKTDVLETDSHMSSAMTSSKTPVKSPRKFVYKKPRLQALPNKTDNLESDSNMPITTSSSRSGKDRNMGSALSPILPHELERDRDTFSAPLSAKADEIRGVADVCGYEITNEVAVVKSVDCCPDDWVFQKREKAKIHSCRVPLHIAFHNYVLSRRSLREAILKYEPVNIDVIHKDLVGYGHRYDPKDLLKFLDKRCITVKTSDNNARNGKR
ncbi:hypothetical protein PYW07_010513 [Mythimna separata]|uniref:Structure-specific endonuclease subunit SLX4 n=1 Tax=Mythimna separata TaxID=271217 RepID=A0AAD8DLS0_MYTSE|nr:hypothetical protein PYW07_010513 [Mythimna separata]